MWYLKVMLSCVAIESSTVVAVSRATELQAPIKSRWRIVILCFCCSTNAVILSSPLQESTHAVYELKAEKLTNHSKLYQSHVLLEF